MSDTATLSMTVRQRLEAFGKAEATRWAKGQPDYVADLGLTRDDVPALIEIAREWWTRTDWPLLSEWTDADDAPIHAWRALGQLRAEEAIPLLLEGIHPLDKRDDEWHIEEFPDVFALIGPPAIEPLIDFVNNARRPERQRMLTICALGKIGQWHDEVRARCAATLADWLADFKDHAPMVNAYFVTALLDSRGGAAHAEVIERAYAADAVDQSLPGGWGDVREELGVEGMGLASDEPNRKWFAHMDRWRPMAELMQVMGEKDELDAARQAGEIDEVTYRAKLKPLIERAQTLTLNRLAEEERAAAELAEAERERAARRAADPRRAKSAAIHERNNAKRRRAKRKQKRKGKR